MIEQWCADHGGIACSISEGNNYVIPGLVIEAILGVYILYWIGRKVMHIVEKVKSDDAVE
jgi:membrane protein DedA with SNARE-associated domain